MAGLKAHPVNLFWFQNLGDPCVQRIPQKVHDGYEKKNCACISKLSCIKINSSFDFSHTSTRCVQGVEGSVGTHRTCVVDTQNKHSPRVLGREVRAASLPIERKFIEVRTHEAHDHQGGIRWPGVAASGGWYPGSARVVRCGCQLDPQRTVRGAKETCKALQELAGCRQMVTGLAEGEL